MRHALVVTLATATAAIFAAGYAAHALEGESEEQVTVSIDKYVNPFDRQKAKETKVGYEYWFADQQLAGGKTLKMSVVGPHLATHAPHRHIEDEFFFVLEGEAEVYLAGERKRIGAMSSFYAPSNVEHGIRNPGDKELKYLVIKEYPGASPKPPSPR